MSAPKATAIILRDDKVLLVRVDNRPFALPCDNMRDPRDPAISAVCRKVSEVLDLEPLRAERLEACDVTDQPYHHHAVRIHVHPQDYPVIMSGITEFIWWDRVTPIKRAPHVDEILEKYDQRTTSLA